MPCDSDSQNKRHKANRRIASTVPRHRASMTLHVMTKNSGSMGNGFGSCMSKVSYTSAPIQIVMMAMATKATISLRDISQFYIGTFRNCAHRLCLPLVKANRAGSRQIGSRINDGLGPSIEFRNIGYGNDSVQNGPFECFEPLGTLKEAAN